MYKVFSMRADFKAKLLNDAGQDLGLNVIGSNYRNTSLFYLFLLKNIFKNNKPDAVIFRYFNDHKNILRSCILAFNVIFTAFLCGFFNIKIFWILHNVDKETSENYPVIVNFLRKFVGDRAANIFVTDPLLVSVAKRIYPQWSSKFDYITFGSNPQKLYTNTDNKVLDALQNLNINKTDSDFTVFCPTAPGDKYTHLKYADKLISAMKSIGINYTIVIVGDLANYLGSRKELRSKLINNDSIVLFDTYTNYNLSDISSYVDFYWRSLSDQSVSFTMYEAASIKKPIITLAEGFMMDAVKAYKLGAVCDFDMSNVLECHKVLISWDDGNAIDFLNKHTWIIAANKILRKL